MNYFRAGWLAFHFFWNTYEKNTLWFKDPEKVGNHYFALTPSYFPLCFYRMQKSLSLRSTSASLVGFWLHTTSPDRRYIVITSYWFLCVSSLSVLFRTVVMLYDGIVYRPPHRWSSGQRVHLRAVMLDQRTMNHFFRGNKCPSLKPMLINASLLSYLPMDINGEEHKYSLSFPHHWVAYLCHCISQCSPPFSLKVKMQRN